MRHKAGRRTMGAPNAPDKLARWWSMLIALGFGGLLDNVSDA
jgi:hypothetical protein